MSSDYSGVNKAAKAATSAAIAASLASAKAGTVSPSPRQSRGSSRKVTPSPANDFRQSPGNSAIALCSAAAAVKSASSKPVPLDYNSAGDNLLNSSGNISVSTRANGLSRTSVNHLPLPHDPKEQRYQLPTPFTETSRGRNVTASSVNRSQSAAATAAAQSANLHRVTSVSSYIPFSSSQPSLEPVAAAAKSYKASSVSPSPADREPSVLLSTRPAVSTRRVVSSASDSKRIRSFSPAPSVRSHVSLPSSSEPAVVAGRIAEHIHGGIVSGSKYMSGGDKNALEGASIQAAARKAMDESHKLATGQAQSQQERGSLDKSSQAFIAARLIAKRSEMQAKTEELRSANGMSQKLSVFAESPQPEVLSPRPQRPTQQWMLSAQIAGNERPDSSASNSVAAIDHSTESATNESASPMSQSPSDLLPVTQLEIGRRTESCPPEALLSRRRPSSSLSLSVSAVKSEKRPIPSHRVFSDVKANLTNNSSRSMAAASSQVLERPPRRRLILNNRNRTNQPSHKYNTFSVGSIGPATGRSSATYMRPSSIYASAQASRSAISLPAVPTTHNDPSGNKRLKLTRLSAEFSPMRTTPFRTTMRKPGKKKHMFDAEKPWKHLIVTGTITETEQKRYAALWAANKGTLLPPELSDCVHNLVVRKIWERSRLNRDMLEKIWSLVSRNAQGYLTQTEFLVGTWVVDQCLYGRKLPLQLSPEVWSSIIPARVKLAKGSKELQDHHRHYYYYHPHRRRSR
ncbi:hypothetical protein V1525DRAFT_402447 [Lipomyces kononenkoae]|uniref:Uncharacterized protein n=1 Tax=Lipomyces kononenkoae TaxID=34357 RepID=A0ACC3T210_LIPKO